MPVVTIGGVLGGKPRLDGRRVNVGQVAEFVLDCSDDPADVADRLHLPLAEVHEVLVYYYNNVDGIETYRRQRDELLEILKKESQ